MLDLNSNQFHLLLGAAGTGKSYTIQQLRETERMYITSSTGISAINNNGSTIHSALGFFNTESLLRKAYVDYEAGDFNITTKFSDLLKNIAAKYQVLVVDEVSMLPMEIVNIIMDVIQRCNINIKVLLVGDFCQLPVVVSDFDQFRAHPFYMSKLLPLFKITYLEEVKRQTNLDFIRALNYVRLGEAARAIDFFENNVGFYRDIDHAYEGTTIIATNKAVDDYNNRNLQRLAGASMFYNKRVTGLPSPDWKSIPSVVEVRVGARVVMLNNNLPEYANGDLGEVIAMYQTCVHVRILRTGKTHIITYVMRDNVGPLDTVAKGTCHFLPIRLAYALTIHRTQGMTLDYVQARLTDNFLATLSGGTYTMLSRIRNYTNLRLIGTKQHFIRSCYLDAETKRFIDGIAAPSAQLSRR
jgi:ATP-dependent DNA helicase PIF1